MKNWDFTMKKRDLTMKNAGFNIWISPSDMVSVKVWKKWIPPLKDCYLIRIKGNSP
jgi:hypothetical protein